MLKRLFFFFFFILINEFCYSFTLPRKSRFIQTTFTPSISAYDYPDPKSSDSIEYIAIAATNDFHGRVIPVDEFFSENKSIKVSGLTLLSSYLDALYDEWKGNLLWLDAGDQYQGSMESNFFGGEPLIRFFNSKEKIMKISTIGNHDFDFGFGNLTQRLTESNFDHLVANIHNIYNDKPVRFPNTFASKIYEISNIKIGIIGLSTKQTPFTIATDLSGLLFKDYVTTTTKESKKLRSQGADIILLLTHVGMRCNKGNLTELKTLGLRYESTEQGTSCSDDDELSIFLSSLPNNTIDAVIAGHTHEIVHHFIKGVPVVIGENFARHFNVIYLAWDKKNKKLLKEKTVIEGPIPICDQIPEGETTCFLKNMKNKPNNYTNLQKFSFHGQVIEEDEKVLKDLNEYIQKGINSKLIILAKIINPMFNSGEEESPLGNYICDVLKKFTKSDICIFNKGGIRINWESGNLSYYTLYQTLPFDNLAVTFELTGQELVDTMKILQAGEKGFYHSSGLLQEVCKNPKHSLLNFKLDNGKDIDLKRVYSVVSNDFLANGGDDFRDVLNKNELKKVKYYKAIREIIANDLMERKEINADSEPCLDQKNQRLILKNCSSL